MLYLLVVFCCKQECHKNPNLNLCSFFCLNILRSNILCSLFLLLQAHWTFAIFLSIISNIKPGLNELSLLCRIYTVDATVYVLIYSQIYFKMDPMHCNGSMLLVDERLISNFSLLPWQGQHCDSSCRISLPLFSIRLNHSSPKMLINFCWINSFKWICQGNALPERVTACKNDNCCKDIKSRMSTCPLS